MNHLPLVSILLVTHNYGHYLPACLDSVLGQTYGNIEIVIEDDGSTDNTAEIVKQYQESHSIIHYHFQEKQKTGRWNFGVAQSCNKALSLAKGEYVCFLAADDRYVPERIETQVKVFQERQNKWLVM